MTRRPHLTFLGLLLYAAALGGLADGWSGAFSFACVTTVGCLIGWVICDLCRETRG